MPQFVPLFSVTGHDSRASKRLFVRPTVQIAQSDVDSWNVTATTWIATTAAGLAASSAAVTTVLPYAGRSLGIQLWGPLDFSYVNVSCDLHVNVSYDNITSSGVADPITVPIAFARDAFRTLVRSLSLQNAEARNFSVSDDISLGGGGYVDCNSCMGEANSHGAFLAGVSVVYAADTGRSTSAFLQKVDRAQLAQHMAHGLRYLLSLRSVATGEIHHEYCQDFEHPTAATCRQNYAGYRGAHHTAAAMMGIVALLESISMVRLANEVVPPELQMLLPQAIDTVNSTLAFLREGAPLASPINGSISKSPSCAGGSCLKFPYWPELEPAALWAMYRALNGKGPLADQLQLVALRARAVESTNVVYRAYNLSARVSRLTTDEGTFRGVQWFHGLYSAVEVAEAESDKELLRSVVRMAAAIASQWTQFVGAEPGKQWLILPLLLDPNELQEVPRYPQNPQGEINALVAHYERHTACHNGKSKR
jgi:hypothetical protein